jgi:hypothetical protein
MSLANQYIAWGVLVTPTPPPLHGSVEAGFAESIVNGLSELLGLSERVRDALSRCWILEVPGVTD